MTFKTQRKVKQNEFVRMQSNNHLLAHCCVICCPNHSERRETRGTQNVCQTKNHYLMGQAEKNPHNLSRSKQTTVPTKCISKLSNEVGMGK